MQSFLREDRPYSCWRWQVADFHWNQRLPIAVNSPADVRRQISCSSRLEQQLQLRAQGSMLRPGPRQLLELPPGAHAYPTRQRAQNREQEKTHLHSEQKRLQKTRYPPESDDLADPEAAPPSRAT